MANHLAGTAGLVKIGSATVAEVKGWKVTTTADIKEDTVLRDTWKTKKSSLKDWNGSLSCQWDDTDATGQSLIVEGAELVLNLYPEGADSGDFFWSGNVIVAQCEYVGELGEIIGADFTFEGNGALVRSTV